VFQRLGEETKEALIVTEGLIIYFDADQVGELARDLCAPPTFKRWVTDLTSPALLRILQKAIGGALADAGSPLKFAPRDGAEFFARYGWKTVETRSLLHMAAQLHRLSWELRLLSLLPDPGGRKPERPWGGVCVLENSNLGGAAHASEVTP
jgi:O-methyltransferase involved in polyketide biosynthesis